jgi:predicted DNA-binding protein (MmcQ/YjbR family)
MDIKKAHAFCASLPGATLDYKWRFEDSVHPVFSVGGRMFAMFSMKKDKLTEGLLFKADDDRFLELTDREGFVPSPYLAKAKWVTLDTPKRLPDAELKALLIEAHAIILAKLSKKKQAEIIGTAPAPATVAKKTVAKKTVAKKIGRTAAAKKDTKAIVKRSTR